MGPTVMIVDVAMFMRKVLRDILEDCGCRVTAEAAGGLDALNALQEQAPDIIMLDIVLPDITGLELMESVVKVCPESKIVICSALGQEQLVNRAMEQGARAFIRKPFSPEQVKEVIAALEV